MSLRSNYPSCLLKPEAKEMIALASKLVCHVAYNRDTWVKLFQVPSEYCADEALLLCQESFDTWVAWIPGYGEMLLDRSHFGVAEFGS
ncbi:MAG: hypothetical protein HC781_20335 [Leptolyngbyaceae cyanobacterium CSU_1_4]|nr:hypothetical protein [Leptolyngbyaceae cyanobacterium CSU_1_4]